MDLLTWRALIAGALSDLYGIVGEARHHDILIKQDLLPALEAVIRIQPEDCDIFISSLVNYSFALSDHLGREYDVSGYVRVEKLSPYLGMVVSKNLISSMD